LRIVCATRLHGPYRTKGGHVKDVAISGDLAKLSSVALRWARSGQDSLPKELGAFEHLTLHVPTSSVGALFQATRGTCAHQTLLHVYKVSNGAR